MTAQSDWLAEVLEYASKEVNARPPWLRSHYWEEERRKIDERRKEVQEARAVNEPPK